MTPLELQEAVEIALTRLLPHLNNEPLLWSLQVASDRTSISTRRLTHLFHAGAIAGLWSAGRGKGTILLKPESVRAWIDAQVADATLLVPSGREKGMAAR